MTNATAQTVNQTIDQDLVEIRRQRELDNAAELAESMAQVVAWDGHGRDVTRGALKAAFDRVADATNWKNPIRKVICEEQLELTAYAVEFFTGSKLMVKQDLGFGRVLVEAVGYYAAVGA